jgi:hypothetical protein
VKYLLKTKGTEKIPDYLQIRDEAFQLIAHCKVSRPERTLEKHDIRLKEGDIITFIKQMPFGKLTPIEEL